MARLLCARLFADFLVEAQLYEHANKQVLKLPAIESWSCNSEKQPASLSNVIRNQITADIAALVVFEYLPY